VVCTEARKQIWNTSSQSSIISPLIDYAQSKVK